MMLSEDRNGLFSFFFFNSEQIQIQHLCCTMQIVTVEPGTDT